jgi:uncharacterized protein (DUF2237 family)
MEPLNVFGKSLKKCGCGDKITGYTRDNYCRSILSDVGTHIVCVIVTNEFLKFTYKKGNDLINPSFGFPGLVEGDCWCVCVLRWIEAYKAGVAPPIILESTSQRVLEYIPQKILQEYSVKGPNKGT